jgi:hypothetical protein
MNAVAGNTPSIFTNKDTQIEFLKYLTEKKGFQFFLYFFTSTLILFFAIVDPNFLTSRTTLYAVLTILPIVVGFFVMSKATISKSMLVAVGLGIVFLLVVGGCFYLINILGLNLIIMNYIFYVVFFLILIIAMAIIYVIFSNAIKRQQGVLGFIIRLIFFIPCLVSDFLEYIRDEFKITHPIIVWLLFLEILLLILQAYLPSLLKKLTYTPKNSLMWYAAYLNDPKTISYSDRFMMKKLNNDVKYKEGEQTPGNTSLELVTQSEVYSDTTFRNSNYAFSFWVYINAGNLSKDAYTSGKTNVFTYGKSDGSNAKPQINYLKDSLVIYFVGSNAAPYLVKIPNQKWVHVVVNYGGNQAELYLDGALKYTHQYANGVPPPGEMNDTVFVGHKDGLDGSIRDVRYFEYAMTDTQINTIFNAGFLPQDDKKNPFELE